MRFNAGIENYQQKLPTNRYTSHLPNNPHKESIKMTSPNIQANHQKIKHQEGKNQEKATKHFLFSRLALLFFLLSGQLLTACIPIAVGVASVTAIEVAHDRRTVGRNIDDNSLEFQLRNAYLADEQLGTAVNISVTIINGIVLLTGEVQTDDQRQHAEAVAKQRIETNKVVNALELSGKTNLTSRVNDAYLTSKVKFKLFRAENVSSSNIKVITERGKVYLLGLVTLAEEEAAVDAATSVRGVTHIIKVFEHIKSE